VVRQAGAVSVDTLDELADMLVTLSYLPPLGGKRVAMVGGGGGAGVLATDDWDENGFVLPKLPEPIRQAWRTALGNDAGTILSNPVDIPHMGFGQEPFLNALAKLHAFEGIDLLVFHMPIRGIMLSAAVASVLFDPEAQTIIKVYQGPGKPVAMVVHYEANVDGWNLAAKQVKKFYEAGLPVYYSIASAAKAIDRYMRYSANRMA
jgi:acyl-CoA synthetase (NDP forming)